MIYVTLSCSSVYQGGSKYIECSQTNAWKWRTEQEKKNLLLTVKAVDGNSVIDKIYVYLSSQRSERQPFYRNLHNTIVRSIETAWNNYLMSIMVALIKPFKNILKLRGPNELFDFCIKHQVAVSENNKCWINLLNPFTKAQKNFQYMCYYRLRTEMRFLEKTSLCNYNNLNRLTETEKWYLVQLKCFCARSVYLRRASLWEVLSQPRSSTCYFVIVKRTI